MLKQMVVMGASFLYSIEVFNVALLRYAFLGIVHTVLILGRNRGLIIQNLLGL
jgi:hypothetical protein